MVARGFRSDRAGFRISVLPGALAPYANPENLGGSAGAVARRPVPPAHLAVVADRGRYLSAIGVSTIEARGSHPRCSPSTTPRPPPRSRRARGAHASTTMARGRSRRG